MIDINELRPAVEVAGLNAISMQEVLELLDRLEAAEKERDSYKLAFSEYSEKTEWVQRGVNDGTVSAKYLGWHRADAMSELLRAAEKDSAHHKALAESALRVAKGWEDKCDALRAKIAEMERQEPLDADSDVFRSAFEAALKAGNWPAARQGDGYRSPSTQIAWRIAFSTVNRLKLYLAPGAKGE
jgi:hypothetical protein